MTIELSQNDLKHYPHFDDRISIDEANALVTNSERVASHKFFPFILYYDEWQPFRKNGKNKVDKKTRPIRYAARRDAYIFTYYRRILADKYEERLDALNVNDSVIAYRKIKKETGRGKCNIDFAKDAFDEIERQGNCVAIALDIKGFFENLDHDRIKRVWCDLLGVDRLPEDHYTIFKNLTQYHFVEQNEVYKRLGYLIDSDNSGDSREGFTIPFEQIPIQLCTPTEFRNKIAGHDPSLPSIIRSNADEHRNLLDRGIPQGAPISDLIANFYLLDFDVEMNSFATEKGGRYMRYSDDILLIVPGGENEGNMVVNFVQERIKKYGNNLLIKPEKTCIGRFNKTASDLTYQRIRGLQGANGFEYLGFRFDGQYVYIRDSTVSRMYSKATRAARRIVNMLVKMHPEMNADEILKKFDYSRFFQKFYKVRRDKLLHDDYRTWTFHSYVKRAVSTFGSRGIKLSKQTRKFKNKMKKRIPIAVEKAVLKRDD